MGVVINLLLAWGLYTRYNQSLPPLQATLVPPRYYQGAVSLAWPGTGSAAIGISGYAVPSAHGDQAPRPIASLAKLMLAAAVLQNRPIKSANPSGAMITFTAKDEAGYNDYVAKGVVGWPVRAGQQISQYQALQVILLAPAGNLADSLAVWAFGSLANYHVAANKLAFSYGMLASHFAGDASGLAPQTVSTPTDMVRLGQMALQQPVIRSIISQPSAEIDNVGTIYNSLIDFNQSQSGWLAIKSGTSKEAGGCFLFAAVQTLSNSQPVTIVGVIMGAPDWLAAFRGAPPLLTSVKQAFGTVTVLSRRQIVAQYKLPWGGSVAAVAARDATVLSWKAAKPRVDLRLASLTLPQVGGQIVGSVNVESPVGKVNVPVVLSSSIPPPSSTWRWQRRKPPG